MNFTISNDSADSAWAPVEDQDYGCLNVRFDSDDSFHVGGYGNAVTLSLPMYAQEARELIEALKPIAALASDDD